MANSTKVAAVLFVFLQVSSAILEPVPIPAVMTLNGFQEGEGGGGPAACDGKYHSDQDHIVSLSSKWFDGGTRCGKDIRIENSRKTDLISATVVDECDGCGDEVGASAAVWRSLHVDPSLGEVSITWSDW